MNRLRASAILFFAAYSVVQYAGMKYAPKAEYFPVFSWSLFSEVRKDVFQLRVEVTRLGETSYDPPVDYFDMPDVFPHAASRDSGLIKAARNLRNAADDPDAYGDLEAAFATSFFAVPERVDFQIVRIRFNPVEHWRTGAVSDRQVLSEHSTEGSR